MLTLTKNQIRLTSIASILGILQGLAWLIMSLLCIIYYLESKNGYSPSFSENPTYMEMFNRRVYTVFLNASYHSPNDPILTPHTFTIFVWIYLILDIIWLLLSVYQIFVIHKAGANPINSIKCWGTVTGLISLVDFLLVILLGADFDLICQDEYFQYGECTNVYIPVLVIAAKGFILWIINVIFVYVVYKIVKTVQSGKNLNLKLHTTDTTIPRATLEKHSKNYQTNAGPTNNNQRYNFNNSNSYWRTNGSGKNTGANFYNNEILATGPTNYSRQQVQNQGSFTGY